jgi:tetratricopeptide (TPR) repeat protein
MWGIDQFDTPQEPDKDWPGFSGSAVLLAEGFDDKVIWIYGVAQQVLPRFKRRLEVARLALAWEDPDFRNALDNAGVELKPPSDPTEAALTPLIGGNLPRGALRFVGRQVELERVDLILRGDVSLPGTQGVGPTSTRARCAVVHGMGGIGKTSLAVEYVFRYRDGYWGVWWCAEATRIGVLTSLAALGEALDLAPARTDNIEKAAKETLRFLSQRPGIFLLVYDNVPDPSEIDGLLPDGGASVLITSRFSDWGELADEVPLLVLREAEGVALLEHRAGRQDSAGAAILVEALGYLPLALEHAAAFCKRTQTSFADYASKAEALIAKVPRGESHPRSIAATFELAIAEAIKQSPAARPLLSYLALCSPERIPMALVEGGVENEQLPEALAALAEISLVKHDPFDDGTAAVTVHRLVQMVARASTPHDDALAARRNLALMLSEIYPSDGATNPKSWPVCARLTPHFLFSRLYVEKHLEEVWGQIFGESIWPLTSAQLDDRAGGYFQGRGAYSLAEPLYRAALDLFEKMHGPEHPTTAVSLSKLAGVLRSQGDLAGARPLFERALAIQESALGPEHQDTAVTLNNIAHLLWTQGDLAGARPLFERALGIFERAGDDPLTTLAIHNIASVLRDSGHLGEARPLFERSLSIRERLDGPESLAVAISLTGLASLSKLEGNFSQAQSLYERAFAINKKELGPDHPDTASSARDLAEILQWQGKLAEARPLYERALAANEKSFGPEHPNTNYTRYYFASLLVAMRCPTEALPLAQAALEALEKAVGSNAGRTKEAAIVTSAALDALGRTDEARSIRRRYKLAAPSNISPHGAPLLSQGASRDDADGPAPGI